jgi:uncharacterized protein
MSRLTLRTVFGALAALVLAGCATAPPKPNPPPLNPGLAVSASQGNPMAELSLGLETLARASTPTERQTAVGWIRRAAEANLAMAQDRLGRMYLTGYAVPQDTSEALSWLQRAASRGAPAAQLKLGQLYAVGALVPVDKVKAYYWYSIAAKPVQSDVTIFNIHQVRVFARKRAQALGASLTPAQRASVSRQVAAWVPISGVPYSGVIRMYTRLP